MSDDEDIESLRIAALQSLIKKSVPDAPKSSSIQPSLTSVNRDFTLASYSPSNVAMDVFVNTHLPPPFYPPPSQTLHGVPPIYNHPPPLLPPWEVTGQNINSRVSPLPPDRMDRRLPLNFRGQRANRGRHIRNRRGDRLEHRHGRDEQPRGDWKESINAVNRKLKAGTTEQENSVITVIKTVECSELNNTNIEKPQEAISTQKNSVACTRVLTVKKEKRDSNLNVKAKDKFERFRDSDESDSSEEESAFGSESDIEPEKVIYDEEPEAPKQTEEVDQEIPQDLDNVSSDDEFLEEIVEEEEEEEEAGVQTTTNDESHQENGIATGNLIETVISSRVTGPGLNSNILETSQTKSNESVPPIRVEYDLQQPIIDSSTGRSPVNNIRNRLGRRNFPGGTHSVSSPYRRSPYECSQIRGRHRTPSLSPSPPADHHQSLIADHLTRSPRSVRVNRSSRSRSPRRGIRRFSPVQYPSPSSRRRSPYSDSPSRLTSLRQRRRIAPDYSPSRKSPRRQSISPRRNVYRFRSRSPLRRIELASRRSSQDRDMTSLRSSGGDVAKEIGVSRAELTEEERQARLEARRRKFDLGEVIVPIKRKISLKSFTSSQKEKETTTESDASEEEYEVKKKSKKKKDKRKKKKKEKKIRKKKKRKSATESESEIDEENASLVLKDKKLKKALSAIESLAGVKIEIKPKSDVKSNEEVSSSVDLRQKLQKRKIRSSQKEMDNYNDSESERSPDVTTSRQGGMQSLDSMGRNVALKYEGFNPTDPLLVKMKEQNAKIEARQREIEEDKKNHS